MHIWCCSAALARQASLFSVVGVLRCTPAWRLHSHPRPSLPMSRPCSVLVHSGGVHGGHYYAFIRPDGQKWIRFDDDRVELVDSNRAVDDQFGEYGWAGMREVCAKTQVLLPASMHDTAWWQASPTCHPL